MPATAKPLWAIGLKNEPHAHFGEGLFGAIEKGGIFILGPSQATCYDERTGRLRWRVSAKGLAFAMPLGLIVPEGSLSRKNPGRVLRLDNTSGKTLGSFPLNHAGAGIHLHGRDCLVVDGPTLRLIDESGRVMAAVDIPTDAQLSVGLSHALLVSEKAVDVYELSQLRHLGRIRGRYHVEAVEGTLGRHRAVLFDAANKGSKSRFLIIGYGE